MYWFPTPSTDLYYLNSCSDLVAHYPWQRRPVQRLGNNTFKCRNRYLIIRGDKKKILRKILDRNDSNIIYLIDDNIWQAPADTALPINYRQRLEQLLNGPAMDIYKQATKIIVSCKELKNLIPKEKPTEILHPCWHTSPPNNKHFYSNTIKLVHLGTNSHMAGYHFLIPVLESILNDYSNVTFTYFSRKPVLGNLDKHQRVFRKMPRSWSGYKKQLGKERFHLGLYPIMDTPFNNTRSYNKILEYSLVGCASIYSQNWSMAHFLETDKNCWLCHNNTTDWINTIRQLIKNPRILNTVFGNTIQLYTRLNDLSFQRAFWEKVLIQHKE